MINALIERIRQKKQTIAFPSAPPSLPDRFRGRPAIDRAKCAAGCAACAGICPTGALSASPSGATIDLGRCLFCGDCQAACPAGAVTFTTDHSLAARNRQDLVLDGTEMRLAEALDKRTRALFGRSLKLRQVSAGGCNACEADLNVLCNVVYDLGRFGIDFVASPRHADGLIITGPVTANMRQALLECLDATPEPRIVIASGACAISGGPFIGMPESTDGAAASIPVDLFIPGCPPHPVTTLDGILRLLGRL